MENQKSGRTFDPVVAMKAQEEYCKRRGLPVLVPPSGRCFRCNRNVFEKHTIKHQIRDPRTGAVTHEYTRTTGISVEEAANQDVTYCPHCNRSFDD